MQLQGGEIACLAEKRSRDKKFILNMYLLCDIRGKLQHYSVPEADIQEQEIHCHFRVQTVS
jgi:hypothetical protein